MRELLLMPSKVAPREQMIWVQAEGCNRGVFACTHPRPTDSGFIATIVECDTYIDRFLSSHSVVVIGQRIEIESQQVPAHVCWKSRYLTSIGDSRAGRSGSVEDRYSAESRPEEHIGVK